MFQVDIACLRKNIGPVLLPLRTGTTPVRRNDDDLQKYALGYLTPTNAQIATTVITPAITNLAIRILGGERSLGWLVKSARFNDAKLLKLWVSVDWVDM